VRELGGRGTVEALGRVVARPLIALVPAVRRTQRLAAVTLVQNPETGRRLRGDGKTKLLSNAFAVELDGWSATGGRTSDLLFVGRLLPWKAPILALRSLQHVKHAEAVLRFCGDGPEQSRLERSAAAWRLTERVTFEGWLPRRQLLELLAHAGALIHPAVHEEAGLCIAEALALGTPVVALDRGGPPQIVGQWRGTASALVSPRGPQATARGIAAAIDRFLEDRPPLPATNVPAATSFRDEILAAYDLAVRAQRPAG
jgi:glycosyltransferase involved in cell wall biosynthesis